MSQAATRRTAPISASKMEMRKKLGDGIAKLAAWDEAHDY